MATELGTGYVSIVPSAAGFGSKVSGMAATEGAGAGRVFSGAFGAAAAVGIVAGAGVALFKVGETFDKGYDTIRVGTGATGDALEGLKTTAKDVLRTVPEGFGDVSTAVADLNTRLGITGKPLDDLSTQFLDLSRITGTDLATNVDNLTRVFGDAGLNPDQYAGALDKVYRASQASGIGLDDLSTSAVQFGAPLRNLGFGFDESLALLGQFNKTGVNTEAVFSGLKIGVGKLAKEGEPVPETFSRIVDEITNLGPGSEATAKAIELFGQRAGPDLADAITGGKFAVDDILGAITGGTDTITTAADDTESFGEKFGILKNKVLVGLEPLASRVFTALGDGLDRLGPTADRFTAALANIDFEKVAQDAAPIVAALGDLGRSVGDLAVKAWPPLFSLLQRTPPLFRALGDATAFLARHTNILVPAVAAVAAAYGAYKVGKAVTDTVKLAVATGKLVIQKGIETGAWIASTAVKAKDLTVLVAHKVGSLALAAASKVVTAGQWLLNAALAANPIGLVVVALVALGAGLFALYKNFEPFRNLVDSTWQGLQRLWDNILPVITAVGGGLVDAFKSAQKVLGPTIGALVDLGKSVGRFLVEPIRTLGEIVGKVFSGDFAGALDTLKGYPARLLGLFGDVLGNIGNYISKAGPLLLSAGGKILGLIVDGLKAFYPTMFRFFLSLPGRILPVIGRLGASLLSAGVNLLGKLVMGLITAVPRVLGFLAGLGLRLNIALTRFAFAAVQKGIDLIGGLLSGLIGALPGVASFLLGLPGRVREWLLGLLGVALEKGRELLGKLVSGLVEKLPEVASFFTSLPGKVVGWLSELLPKLKKRAAEAVGGLVGGLQERIPAVLSFFTGLPGRIVGWLGDLSSTLVDAGKDVVSGLIGGLTDALGGLVDAAKDMGGALVDGFKSGLGISSPSKVMAVQGGFVVDGLVSGIDDRTGAAEKAALRLGSATTAAFVAGRGRWEADSVLPAVRKVSMPRSMVDASSPSEQRIEIPVSIDGREVARATYPHTAKMAAADRTSRVGT